jgi:tetratricopeptide (TPR) repeat protein
MSEIHQGMPIKRNAFNDYLRLVVELLNDNYPQILAIPSRPGAGASTLVLCLAYELAFKHYVPTLILERGGQHAFEAIERLHRLVRRPFLVVVDPEDVGGDDVRMLKSRCAPSRYPALFLTSTRTPYDKSVKKNTALQRPGTKGGEAPATLSLELDKNTEREQFLRAMATHCPDVRLSSVASSPALSFFLLSLDAVGGERVDVDRFVKHTMSQGSAQARSLLATVALFSRFAHRLCTVEFLEIVSGSEPTDIEDALRPYEQLLVLQQNDGWSCRHEELSKRILQYQLTDTFDSDEYRSRLSDFICDDLLNNIDDDVPGCEIVADYIWSLMNPQLESRKSLTDEKTVSRLFDSDEGLRYNPDRYKVYVCATQTFPRNVNILSHFGKYLAETEGKCDEADKYLQKAYELEPENKAVLHMLGKRYKDEVQDKVNKVKADVRDTRDNARIDDLAKLAHEWFDRARRLDLGSEYNYTTPVELDIILINDEFHKFGLAKHDQAGRVEKITEPRILQLFTHSDGVIAEGLRYLEPRDESRKVFNRVRSELTRLRGDLDAAITLLEKQVVRVAQGSRPAVSVQLARYLVERAEKQWLTDDKKGAARDFKKAQKYLDFVLQDPKQSRNIKLWFDSARHLAHLSRNELLQRMHRYHDGDVNNLDGCFLLMCLYFCEAIETRSREAWRKCEQCASQSAQLSSALGVRRATREWLVKVTTGKGTEYRVYPSHLYHRTRQDDSGEVDDRERQRLRGTISSCKRATAGLIRIDDCGFEIFFQPRVEGREYYEHDEGARVEFLVSFTYEKPQAFDVTRL